MALLGLAGCVQERVLAAGRAYRLAVVSGDGQVGPAGGVLPQPLGVVVRDAAGRPVKAAVVVFRIERGAVAGAAMLDSLAVTDGAGIASAELRLGAQAGVVEVSAFPMGAEDRGVTLRATAASGPDITGVLPSTVGPGDTLIIGGRGFAGASSVVEFGTARVRAAAGSATELRVVVPDCLPTGATAVRVLSSSAWTAPRSIQYAARRRALSLRPYEAAVLGASELGSCVSLATDTGAEYIVIPQFASRGATPTPTTVRVSAGALTTAGTALRMSFDAPSSRPSLRNTLRIAIGGEAPVPGDAQAQLDATLRAHERRLAPAARAAAPSIAPMLALTVGSRRTFQVITSLAGDQFADATGELRFVGEHLGIYVDTATRAAYTELELQRLGALFEKELYHVAVENFGPESDIDRNGKVLVFLTPRVNALVAAADCGARGFVTGFFYGRDLLPSTTGSNNGEIFYALVPDPTGRYSCSHASYDTQRLAASTFVHEMQHMISFFHHVVARGGEPEEHWINEGLSHVAEELASRVFEARYPWPLGRVTLEQLFPDSAAPFISQQLMNAYVFLNSSAAHSVTTFFGTGSMEERGAAWMFLRWLGDQKGESIYRRLVQTSLTGMANIEARSGEPFAALFGDFSVALWADSLPGVPRAAVASRYRFATRNLRQLMARQALISGWPNAWPVVPVRVPFGGYAEGSLLQGTMVYGTLGPFSPASPPVVLSLTKSVGGAFAASDGAQLGVLRVR